MTAPLDQVSVVLVATTHPGNIGAAARAMKTMGIKRLALVDCGVFPSAEATARASGADDLLMAASVHPELEPALAGCGLVYGTSGRRRNIPWPVQTPRAAAHEILARAAAGTRVALLFGRESSGLSNRELESCHGVIQIPTEHGFASLNIASAVQILCYELRLAALELQAPDAVPGPRVPLADSTELQRFYDVLEEWITETGYYDPDKPRLLMRRLRRLFNRARLDVNEYNILMGIIAAARQAARHR